jgi:hypothetical protein
MEFIKELFNFIRKRKKYWLIPIIVFILAIGGILVLTQGSAVAPFIYTIF